LDDIGGGRQDTFVRFEILAKSWVGIQEGYSSPNKNILPVEYGNLNAVLASGDVEYIVIYSFDGKKLGTSGPEGVHNLPKGVYILHIRKAHGQTIRVKYGVTL
jgi:hypothetical protein